MSKAACGKNVEVSAKDPKYMCKKCGLGAGNEKHLCKPKKVKKKK
jgi:hypothetical protein